MNPFKHITIIFLLLITCYGCTKTELLKYDSGNQIYFGNISNSSSYKDTFSYSFALDTLNRDTLLLYIYTLGDTTGNHRPFNLSVLKDSSTAIEGKHFIIPPPDSLFIPAGKTGTTVPVIILRTTDMYEKSFRFILQLKPNNNFETNIHLLNPLSDAPVSLLKIRFDIDDLLKKPSYWDENADALGSFSRKKLELFVKQLDLDISKFYTENPYTGIQLLNYSKTFQSYLNEQQQSGNTVLEADGSIMKMGKDAQ
ncbi:hypothetical protein COR50_19030 [Chitinophaga caeni]|uniref:DUF4843 domain-containing protein n=1 Tax=Chitinophaga caeni TaxID=2029983 RepID=A0A291QZ17_9BACT|nr:DUF4843 domain-containing protein [Chitinophaga caeni]ATL49094.1 hypothetical protein COR50_19030 [Chitinophaga caeni]